MGQIRHLASPTKVGVVFLLIASAVMALAASSSSGASTCTLYWTGKTSTEWGVKANWSTTDGGAAAPRTPASTDFICMSTAPTRSAIKLGGTATIAGASWGKSGSVTPIFTDAGSLTIATEASVLANTTVTGHLITKVSLTVENLTVQEGGTLDGPGTITVPAGGSVKLDATNGYVSLGSTKTVKLVNNGSGSIVGNENGYRTYLYGGSVLENAGTLSLSSNTYVESADGNAANRVLNDAGATISYEGTSATAPAAITVPSVNNGTIGVVKGNLELGPSPSGSLGDTGKLDIAPGATAAIVSGTHKFGSGATLPNTGTLEVRATLQTGSSTGGTIAVKAGGDLVATSATSINTLVAQEGGALDGPGTITVPAGGSLKLDATNGYVNLGSNKAFKLLNNGSGSVLGNENGYRTYLYGGSVLENAGTLSLSSDAHIESADGNAANRVLNDSGATISYEGTSATAPAGITAPSVNNGTIGVAKGLLEIGPSPTSSPGDTGKLDIALGATAAIVSGTHKFGSGATLPNTGTLEVRATLQTGSSTGGTIAVKVGGDLAATSATSINTLTVQGGGTVDGPGTITVPAGGSLKLAPDSNSVYLGTTTAATVVNKGTGSVTAGESGYRTYLYGGSVLENAGTLSFAAGAYLDSDGNAANRVLNDSGATISYEGTSATAPAGILAPSVNNGTIGVVKGNLELGPSPSSSAGDTGKLDIGPGTTATIAAGTRKLGSGATVTNTGTLAVRGADLAVAAATSIYSLTVQENGSLDGPGTVTVPTGGSLKLLNGSGPAYLGLTTGLTVVNKGTGTIVGSEGGSRTSFYNGSVLENAGTLSLSTYAYLESADGKASNRLLNDAGATVSYAGAAAGATIGVPLKNEGTVSVTSGRLVTFQPLNLASQTLTGGAWNVQAGTLVLPENVAVNAATVSLGASGAIEGATANALTALTKNTGTLTLGRALQPSAGLANSGTITVGAGVLNPTAYTQTAGTTTVAAGAGLAARAAAGEVLIEAGTLTGNGTVTGKISGAGTLRPGSEPGPLTNSGTYVQGAASTLAIPISGPSVVGTDFGQLSSSGAVTLAGTLAIQVAPGYLPPVGTVYTIAKAASFSGGFSTITGAKLADRELVLGSTPTTLTLTVQATGQAPTITSANSASFTAGSPGSFTITTSGSPKPAITETGTLPAGITFKDNGDGTAKLVGTAYQGGTYPITLKASNGVGPEATQSFTLTVRRAPTITSANSAKFTAGTAGSFTITTSGYPKPAITETGTLPAGITFKDNGDGTAKLSGVATEAGVFPLTIKASNGFGTDASQAFTLTVQKAPSFTSANSAKFAAGTAGSFTITTSGYPKPAITETGTLPAGITFKDNGDGTATLAGTPESGTQGNYPLTIGAVNGVGTEATQSFTLTVEQAKSPVFTSAAAQSFATGVQGNFEVTTQGPASTLAVTAGTLPAGLTFVDNGDGTATLAGTPSSTGTYNLTFTATATEGGQSKGTQQFQLSVGEASAPTFGGPTSASFTTGQAGSLTVTTTGTPTPYITRSGALPSGVAFTDNGDGTATIAGTPAAGTSDTYRIVLIARNGIGAAARRVITIVVS